MAICELIFVAGGCFALIDEIVRVEAARQLLVERFEHPVLADAAEPILAVAKVSFHAMHNPVPVAALGRFDVLADRVRTIQFIVQQPQPATTACRHVLVSDGARETAVAIKVAQIAKKACAAWSAVIVESRFDDQFGCG